MNLLPRESRKKLMNRLKSPYFWFAFMSSLFVVNALSFSFMLKKDITQDNLQYRILTVNTVDRTGTVAVVGSQNARTEYEVIIPSSVNSAGVKYSVTQIGEQAFCFNNNLTNVTIPNCVTHIGGAAFANCTGLTNLIIGKSVTHIGDAAFSLCVNLKTIEVDKDNQSYASVDGVLLSKDMTSLLAYPSDKAEEKYTIPDGVIHIGNGAFRQCSRLTSVTLPESVTQIGACSFEKCTNLNHLIIGKNVTHIYFRAFHSCNKLKNVTLPDSVVSIGEGAFAYCNTLTNVIIGKGVTRIEEDTFAACSLTKITLPDNVTHIEDYAFAGCRFTDITFPDRVISIGKRAFYSRTDSTAVYFMGPPPKMGEELIEDLEERSFDKNAVLYYVEGTPGWTTPTWEGYTTKTWTPEP